MFFGLQSNSVAMNAKFFTMNELLTIARWKNLGLGNKLILNPKTTLLIFPFQVLNLVSQVSQ